MFILIGTTNRPIPSPNMRLLLTPTPAKTGSTHADAALPDSPNVPRACAPPPVNAATLNLIKQFEGFVPSPRPDPIGPPTVGYGHLCKTRNCAEVPYRFPLTQAQATALLQNDLKTFTQCVSTYIQDTVRLNDNQYGALVSWAFNVGCGNARTSSLIRRLSGREDPNTVASQELPK